MSEEVRVIPCIICPVGCTINVTMKDGKVESVKGNTCKRGEVYAKTEVLTPSRTLTSTVKVRTKEGIKPVSVRTEKPIPKDLLFKAMKELNSVELDAPVKVGDVVIHNILNTGVNLIATSNIK